MYNQQRFQGSGKFHFYFSYFFKTSIKLIPTLDVWVEFHFYGLVILQGVDRFYHKVGGAGRKHLFFTMKIFLLRSDIAGRWTTSLHFGFAPNGENLPWQEVNTRKSTTDARVQDTLILVVIIYECLSLYRWQWLMNYPPHIKVSSFALVEPHSLPASRVFCRCDFLFPVRPTLHIQICAGFL